MHSMAIGINPEPALLERAAEHIRNHPEPAVSPELPVYEDSEIPEAPLHNDASGGS
jgi:hypothetical protein